MAKIRWISSDMLPGDDVMVDDFVHETDEVYIRFSIGSDGVPVVHSVLKDKKPREPFALLDWLFGDKK